MNDVHDEMQIEDFSPEIDSMEDASFVRVSRFSFHESPQHSIIHVDDMDDDVDAARNSQYGVVLSYPSQPEPERYNGPGVEDLRK